ncbi:MAG: hypothetical protein Tsb005_12450 [Gammaproteobacteria bacterium]
MKYYYFNPQTHTTFSAAKQHYNQLMLLLHPDKIKTSLQKWQPEEVQNIFSFNKAAAQAINALFATLNQASASESALRELNNIILSIKDEYEKLQQELAKENNNMFKSQNFFSNRNNDSKSEQLSEEQQKQVYINMTLDRIFDAVFKYKATAYDFTNLQKTCENIKNFEPHITQENLNTYHKKMHKVMQTLSQHFSLEPNKRDKTLLAHLALANPQYKQLFNEKNLRQYRAELEGIFKAYFVNSDPHKRNYYLKKAQTIHPEFKLAINVKNLEYYRASVSTAPVDNDKTLVSQDEYVVVYHIHRLGSMGTVEAALRQLQEAKSRNDYHIEALGPGKNDAKFCTEQQILQESQNHNYIVSVFILPKTDFADSENPKTYRHISGGHKYYGGFYKPGKVAGHTEFTASVPQNSYVLTYSTQGLSFKINWGHNLELATYLNKQDIFEHLMKLNPRMDTRKDEIKQAIATDRQKYAEKHHKQKDLESAPDYLDIKNLDIEAQNEATGPNPTR